MLVFLSPRKNNEEVKKQKNNPVKVRSLDIKVGANQFVANSFLQVELYNSGIEIMDGSWEFSLEDGQVINGFSLDINGKQRQGVVVEKNKGRIAYETVVNRKIDPGLLENTGGNNYRVRVYPVAAKSSRIITIHIAQQMRPFKNEVQYNLPLRFESPIENFSLNIHAISEEGNPIAKAGMISGLSFHNNKLELERKQFTAAQPVSFAIPLKEKSLHQCIDENGNFSLFFPYNLENKSQGNDSVTVFWDVSSSSKHRDIEKELGFLKSYIQKERPSIVKLILFSNEVHEKRVFVDVPESMNEIVRTIRNFPVDGATNLELLGNNENISGINILFSDGLNNFGDDPEVINTMHTVSSSSINNIALLRNFSKSTGGHFIDLNQMEIGDAIKLLDQVPLQDVKYEAAGTKYLFAFYENGFVSVSGKMNENFAKIKLQLPGGGDKQFDLDMSNTCATEVEAAMLSAGNKYYSSEKIDSSQLFKRFAAANTMVSPFTSLIVLDNLSDYIRFNIMPPADLIDEYNNKVTVKLQRGINDIIKVEKKINDEDFREEIVEDLAGIFNYKTSWWKKLYSKQPVKLKVDEDMNHITASRSSSGSTGTGGPANVQDSTSMHLSNVLQPEQSEMNEVIIVADGAERRTEFSGADVVSSPSTMRALSGRAPGISVGSGAPGYVSNSKTSGNNSDNEEAQEDKLLTESDTDILANYQAHGKSSILEFGKLAERSFTGKEKDSFYRIYLDLKKTYGTHQEFYITISNLFHSKGLINDAARILSNLCEMELEDPALLRAMAYISESRKDFRSAVFLYSKVLSLRNDQLHAYRDLALAHKANGDNKKATEILQEMLLKRGNVEANLDGLKEIALTDLDNISGRNRQLIKDESLRSIFSLPLNADLRVIVDWNKDQTDIDLHIKEPSGEVCNYKNKITKSGGRYADDVTTGFGPEEYMIRKAGKGNYEISINYYNDNYQREEVPAIVKLTIIKYFGTDREVREIKAIMLDSETKSALIGTVSF